MDKIEGTESHWPTELKSVRLHYVAMSKVASSADIDFMVDMPVDEAIEWLVKYKKEQP